jgi:hypothetical protein
MDKSISEKKDGTIVTKAEKWAKSSQKAKHSDQHHFSAGRSNQNNTKMNMKIKVNVKSNMKTNVERTVNMNTKVTMNKNMNEYDFGHECHDACEEECGLSTRR